MDEQFLSCVIEGDTNKLENLLQLGANIAYSNPNSHETAVSLCIKYHSVDLLKFLENRGAVLTSPADVKGLNTEGVVSNVVLHPVAARTVCFTAVIAQIYVLT